MTAPGAAIRPATGADTDACLRVFVRAWRGGYQEVVPPHLLDLDEATAATWMRPPGADPGTATALAEVDGTVRGFVRYGVDPDDPAPDLGYVAALYVDPAAGGQGLGRLLLDHAIDRLGAQGRPRVALWVFEANNRARALYESAGFRATGARLVDPRWQTPQIRMLRTP